MFLLRSGVPFCGCCWRNRKHDGAGPRRGEIRECEARTGRKSAVFARTEYGSVRPFAVKAGALAIPQLLVSAVAVAEPVKMALVPLEGAVNQTVAPLSGLPLP